MKQKVSHVKNRHEFDTWYCEPATEMCNAQEVQERLQTETRFRPKIIKTKAAKVANREEPRRRLRQRQIISDRIGLNPEE